MRKYEVFPSNQDRIDGLRNELNISINNLRTDLTTKGDSKASITSFHWALGLAVTILGLLFAGNFTYINNISEKCDKIRLDMGERITRLETKLEFKK